MRWTSALAVMVCLFYPSLACAQAKPKNIVLIVADDLGLQVGCYGDTVVRTPNIDALAKKGVRFARAYATVASCSPSRASIYSGLFTHQSGQYGLAHAPHSQQCHKWVEGLPNLLRAAGFFTGIIGKFHVQPQSSYQWDVEIAKVPGGRSPEGFAKLTTQFLAQRGNKPFFLVVGFQDPHRAGKGFGNEAFAKDAKEVKYDPGKIVVPAYLPDTPETRQDLAEYYQAVSRMDRGVGLVLQALQEAGQLDDTLIIFCSDNGIPFPRAKTTLYAAGTHLPLIVAGPGVPQGRTNNALVSWVDLAPTILDVAKAKGPSYKLPGKSILPILNDDNPKGWDAVFGSHQFHEITMYYPMRSITTTKYKYIVNLAHEREYPFASDLWGSPTWQGVRERKDKMMGKVSVETFLHRPKEELFDLTKDPGELVNVASDPAYQQVLQELRGRVQAWQEATGDPWVILRREEKTKYNK